MTSQTPLLAYLLFAIVLGVGCSRPYGENAQTVVPKPHHANMTCKEYLQSIPSFWKVREGYYEFEVDSMNFYGKFVQNTNVCFQGFSVADIERYLGKPNLETPVELVYFVTEPCLTRNRDCNVQMFTIEDGFFKETKLISPKQYRHGGGWW